MKNKQGGYAIPVLIAIIAVLTVGAGVYIYENRGNFLTSSDSQLSDLKTYTNTNFEYEIKYPNDFTLSEANNSPIESPTRDIIEINSSQIRMGLIASSDINSINDECRDVSYLPSVLIGSNTFKVLVTETAVNDMGKPDFVHRDYYLKTRNFCYLIAASYPPSLPQKTKDAYNSKIEAIVSTFKSISSNTSQSHSGSDQLTYSNDEYHFSFNYPNTWTVGTRSPSNLDMFWIPLVAKQALADYKQKYGNDSISMALVGVTLSNLDPKTWYQQNMGSSATEDKQLTINGYPAYYVKQSNQSYADIDYVVSHNGLILRFAIRTFDHGTNLNNTGQSWTNDYSAYLPDFEKIVNSIKFSNQQ